MSRRTLLVSLATAAILLSPFWIAHLIWRLAPIRELDLLVVDYTVPTHSYSHHRGLFWLLNHLRIYPPGAREEWDVEKNYVGYKPGKQGDTRRISQIELKRYQWVYLSDTYGVYDIDLVKSPGEKLAMQIRPKLLFGGLTLQDAEALSDFVGAGGNLILEFNVFTGTARDPARKLAEKLVGMRWTGWAGRMVDELRDKTITPRWLPELYRANYPNRAFPKGPALFLVHSDGRLVVLHGETLEATSPSLSMTKEGRAILSGAYASPPYFGWFAIMEPQKGVEILAEITLPAERHWRQSYLKASVPLTFPLVTRLRDKRTTRIYIAADIANLEETPRHYQLAGLPLLQAAVNRRRDIISNRPAYWQFYVPVVGKLLRNASSIRD
ncbi:MAG: hypothetical protein JXA30_17040 [Deltaproteobacteria bacterium]|nr:hypothetical protein [Deltaproteobacteria bacterium]